MKFIYEVVDYTNDELYYPLAIFESLEDAKTAIDEAEKPDRTISPWQDEETDEYLWKRV